MKMRVCAATMLCVLSTAALAAPDTYRTIPVEPLEPEAPLKAGEVEVSFGGFVKLDVLYSHFSDGDVDSQDFARMFFRPQGIPVAGSELAEDDHAFLDFHARDTRFGVKVTTPLAGHELGGHVEMDFRSSPGGATEITTNAYNPRLYRAVLTYDRWLLGQEWSLLRNLDASPDLIDDVRGPSEALTIVRQPQLRYTWGDLAVALENAETNVLPRAGTVSGTTPVTAAFVTGDSAFADLSARYQLKTSWGSYAAALVLRQLQADNAGTGGDAPNNAVDGSVFAFGVSLSGKVPTIGQDDVRFAFTGGDGIGRYVGLGLVADAVVDDDNGLEPLPAYAGYVSYRRVWSPRWRSSLALAALAIDNPTALTGTGATSGVRSGHVNLLYAPVEKLTFGVELTHGVREVENGQDGSLSRAQFSTKYEF